MWHPKLEGSSYKCSPLFYMSSFSCSATICTMNDRLSKADDRRSRFPPALSPLGEEGLLYISSPRNHTLSPGMDSECQLVPALPESKSFQNLAGQDTLTSFWERDLIIYVYQSFLEMQIPYQERKMILEFHHSFMFYKRLPLQLQIFPACSLYSLIFPVFLSLYFFPSSCPGSVPFTIFMHFAIAFQNSSFVPF